MTTEQNLEVMLKLEQNLQNGKLALVRIRTVEDAQVCHGCGQREDPMDTEREYIGIVNVKRERLTEDAKDAGTETLFEGAVIDSVTIFDQNRFLLLDGKEPEQYPPLRLISNTFNHKKLAVHVSNLDRIRFIEFSDADELNQRLLYEHHMRGDCMDSYLSHNIPQFLPRLTSIDVFVGDSSVLYDYITASKDPFLAREIFIKLGLEISDKLNKSLESHTAAEIVLLYQEYTRHPREEDYVLRSTLERIRNHMAVCPVQSVDLGNGITITVPKFLESVEKSLAPSRTRAKQ